MISALPNEVSVSQDQRDGRKIIGGMAATVLLGWIIYISLRQGIPQWLATILLAGVSTAITSVFLYYFSKHVSEQAIEFEKVKRKIIEQVFIRENVLLNFDAEGVDLEEINGVFRRLAARLSSSYQTVHWKLLSKIIFSMPSTEQIDTAIKKLIFMSNVKTLNNSDDKIIILEHKLSLVNSIIELETSLAVSIDKTILGDKEMIEVLLSAAKKQNVGNKHYDPIPFTGK